MGKISWKTKESKGETSKGRKEQGDVTKRLLPIAEEIAETMGGSPVALFVDTNDEDTVNAVVSMREGALALIEIPRDAETVDDADEHAKVYSSGLQLAKDILDVAEFSSTEGRDSLMGVLTEFDRAQSVKVAAGWLALVMKHKIGAPPTK